MIKTSSGKTLVLQRRKKGRPAKDINMPILVDLYNKGFSIRYIAEYFNVSVGTIENRINQIDVKQKQAVKD